MASSTEVASLIVSLQLKQDSYQKGLAQAAKQADEFKKRVESQTKTAEKSTSRLQSVLTSASSKVQAAMGKVGGALDNLSGGRLNAAVSAISGRLSPAIARLGAVASKIGPIVASAGAAVAAGIAAAVVAVVAGAAAIGVALGAVTAKFFQLAKVGAPLIGVKQGFEGLTSTIEGGAQRMLRSLQEAGAGMIANSELMQRFNTAAQLVGTQFAQNLPDALRLLQKVAFSTGQDMDFLLNSLIVGVGRLSPLILDNLNITVDTALAYETFAESVDKSASALSKAEKQTALTNQVIQRLEENTARLPDVAGSAAQAFGALRTDLQNIREEMGMRLAPAFAKVLNGLRKFVPALRTMGLGFAEVFVQMVGVAESFVRGLLKSMGRDMDSLANAAQGWGENIVLSLARGMARAAAAVISVLNAIGKAIANWLAPGSPPQLLPDIDDWGTAAMDEFLQGMAGSDVGILRDLSGKLESAIRSLGGGMDPAAIAEQVLGARAGLEEAIAGGGDLFAALPPMVHGYASALLVAESASERVAQAQEELNRITQEYEDRLSPLNAELDAIAKRRQEVVDQQRKTTLQSIISDANAPALAKELAQMELREIELRNQRDAVEEERDAAVTAAEDKLTAAEREQQAAEERLRLEEQLLQHQIETNNLLQDTVQNLNDVAAAVGSVAGAGGGGGGGPAALGDQFEDLAAGVGGASNSIGSSIEELAGKIQAEFVGVKEQARQLGLTWGGIFADMDQVVWAFRQGVKGNVVATDSDIANFVNSVGLKWNQFKTDVEGIKENFQSNMALLGDAKEEFKRRFVADIGVVLTKLGDFNSKVDEIKETWQGNWELMQTIIETAKTNVSEHVGTLTTELSAFKTNVLDSLTSGFNSVRSAIQRVHTWLGNLITKISNFPSLPAALSAMIHQSPPPLALGMDMVRAQMRALSSRELPMLERQMSGLTFPGMGAVGGSLAGAGSTNGSSAPPINFGDVFINNGMDMMQFEARVRRIVNQEAG